MSELISSSAEAIEGNDYLLTQILIRLPLKDVITFKRVSKRWRSLIFTPYFRRCHLTLKSRVSESGTWKQCGSSFSASLDMDFAHGTYFNFSVYWICNESKTALRFDLNKECIKDDLPLLPSLKPAESHYRRLYVLAPACGYMNLVGHADYEYCVRVFRLEKEQDNSLRWVLKHCVDLQFTLLPTERSLNIASKAYNIIHLIEDGEDEMALLLDVRGKVIALRLKDKTRHHVFDLPHHYLFNLPKDRINFASFYPPVVKGWYSAFEYIESLASVFSIHRS
ncbi:hypothetical protein PIB30_015902 [Stylosanthes scabra]|uniref:F-box domain-containing protein n=1 Tax=Stylosanthes scabra TaxID=79078 RepID=A0ABU6T713_9FABA|nr:hypothetical protein [Stylosanthes scabra]